MKARSTSYALLLIALAMFPSLLHSQTLTLGSLPKQAFCAGEQFQLSYTASGAFTPKNSFVVQLSDETGNFASFQNIGSVRTTNSGMVTVTIPTSITISMKYRIRLMSTDPFAVSADNGADLSMGPVAEPRLDYSYETVFGLINEEIEFKHRARNAVSVRWDFGTDATPQFSTETAPRVRFSTPGFKTINMTAISAGGCEVTRTFGPQLDYPGEAFIYVATCNPKIPANVIIDSFESPRHDRDAGPFWVVPGGEFTDSPMNTEFFVEAGGTVKDALYYNVVYLKAGASLVQPMRGALAIREPGASIIDKYNLERINVIECDNLEFDYSDAPPYKINQASVAKNEEPLASIYPNPTSSMIYRANTRERLIEARLYNVTGALVSVSLEPRGSEIMSVRTLPEGLYCLELQYADGIRFQKILIQK